MTVHRLKDINSAIFVVALILALLLAAQILRPTGVPETETNPVSGAPSRFPDLKIHRGGGDSVADYAAIVDKNLFSSERRPPSGRSRSVSHSSGTGEGTASYEGLELIGTVLAGDDRSFALIRKGGVRGEIGPYRVQESVEGLELQDILYDRVVLSQNGKEVVLLLEPREEERKATQSTARRKQAQQKQTPQGKKARGQQGWTPKKRKGQ